MVTPSVRICIQKKDVAGHTEDSLCTQGDCLENVTASPYARIEQDGELPRTLCLADLGRLHHYIECVERADGSVNLTTT